VCLLLVLLLSLLLLSLVPMLLLLLLLVASSRLHSEQLRHCGLQGSRRRSHLLLLLRLDCRIPASWACSTDSGCSCCFHCWCH
jgi:hypothetical protein